MATVLHEPIIIEEDHGTPVRLNEGEEWLVTKTTIQGWQDGYGEHMLFKYYVRPR